MIFKIKWKVELISTTASTKPCLLQNSLRVNHISVSTAAFWCIVLWAHKYPFLAFQVLGAHFGSLFSLSLPELSETHFVVYMALWGVLVREVLNLRDIHSCWQLQDVFFNHKWQVQKTVVTAAIACFKFHYGNRANVTIWRRWSSWWGRILGSFYYHKMVKSHCKCSSWKMNRRLVFLVLLEWRKSQFTAADMREGPEPQPSILH